MKKREIIYIAIILILAFFMLKGCQDKNTFEKIYNQSQDSLHVTRNKLNQEVTTTALLYGNLKDFKNIHAADSSTIGKLQHMVDKFTISATSLSNVTGNSFSSATQTILIHDTVTRDGIKYLYPEYQDSISNRWERFKLIANKDSFHIEYKVFNEFKLKQEWKKNGLFKRRTAEASVTNLNPHTETLEYKTFTIEENKNNRLRDIFIGAAAAFIITEALNVFQIRIPIKLK